MDVQVNWSRSGEVLVAVLSGRVDSSNSATFHDALKEGIPDGERALAIDCSGLSYLSSAGLRVLLDMVRVFREPNKALALCELSGSIASVVRLSGFDKIIPVHETRAEAVAAIRSQVDFDKVEEEEEVGEESQESTGAFSFRLGKRSTTM